MLRTLLIAAIFAVYAHSSASVADVLIKTECHKPVLDRVQKKYEKFLTKEAQLGANYAESYRVSKISQPLDKNDGFPLATIFVINCTDGAVSKTSEFNSDTLAFSADSDELVVTLYELDSERKIVPVTKETYVPSANPDGTFVLKLIKLEALDVTDVEFLGD